MQIALDERQTLVVAILVLFLGKYLVRRVAFLRDFNISEPVTGGVIASLISGGITFDTLVSGGRPLEEGMAFDVHKLPIAGFSRQIVLVSRERELGDLPGRFAARASETLVAAIERLLPGLPRSSIQIPSATAVATANAGA